jgi:type III secretion protein Q
MDDTMSLHADPLHCVPDESAVLRLPEADAVAAKDSLPLLQIAAQHVAAINMFYKRRSAAEVTVAGHSLRIATSWPGPQDALLPDMIHIELRLDGAPAELTVPRSVLDRMISPVISTEAWRRLDVAQAMIVLELVLNSALEAIEADTGVRITFIALHTDMVRPRATGYLCVGFAVQSPELGAWRSLLRLPTEPAMRLASMIEKYGRAEPAEVDIGARARLRIAAATLTMRELRGLSAGDVVLVDDRCAPMTGLVVIAERLAAPAELLPEGGKLIATPMRLRGSMWEWAMTDLREATGGATHDEANLDDIPVRVTFELGQVELSLGEIRNLAPGYLVPLSRPLDDAVDIVANGRRLGRGTLVSIGDSVGVQISRLFGHE